MKIEIPDEVYATADRQPRGTKRMAVLNDYLSGRIPEGERLTGWERIDGRLYAVTGT